MDLAQKVYRQMRQESNPERERLIKRKIKLRMRFKSRIDEEIAATVEKLMLLYDIKQEITDGRTTRPGPKPRLR